MTTPTAVAPNTLDVAVSQESEHATAHRRRPAALTAALLALAASAGSFFLWLTNIYGYNSPGISYGVWYVPTLFSYIAAAAALLWSLSLLACYFSSHPAIKRAAVFFAGLATAAVATRVLEAITVSASQHLIRIPQSPEPGSSHVLQLTAGTTTHPFSICVSLLLFAGALYAAGRAAKTPDAAA